jgi:transposase
VQYGPRVCTTITDLRNEHFIPEDRLAKLMGNLFNVPLSRGTVGAITCRKAEDLRVVSDAIFEMVAQAPVKNLDETGCRVNGTLGWMHVATTPDLTHYRYSKKTMPSGLTRGGATCRPAFAVSWCTIIGNLIARWKMSRMPPGQARG